MIERDRQFMLFGLSPDRFSARGLWLLAAVWFGSLLVAGLIAPLIYFAVQSIAEAQPGSWAASLMERPFDRFVDRCRYVPVLLLLPVLLAATGLLRRNGFWRANDLRGRPLGGFWLGYGLALGLALSGLLVALQLACTWYWPADIHGAAGWLKLIGSAALSAVLVGVIEEILFRSLIFRICYTALRPSKAVLVASAIYAYLHFRAPAAWLESANADPGLLAGLQVALLSALGPFLDFDPLAFANYTALGALLCVLYLRAKTLWAPVGLHAGIVFVMLLYQRSVHVFPDAARWFFGGGGFTDGVLPLILTLALTALFTLRLPVSRR